VQELPVERVRPAIHRGHVHKIVRQDGGGESIALLGPNLAGAAVTLQIIWRSFLRAIWRKPAPAVARRWQGGL